MSRSVDKKCHMVSEYCKSGHGIDEAARLFGIKESTVERYLRKANPQAKSPAKILIFDIETSAIINASFRTGKTYVSPKHVLRDWHIICWSATWLGSPEMMYDVQSVKEAREGDDRRVVLSMWKLLDEADIVVAHNGNRFDIKRLNARFFYHDIAPPSPYRKVDTLKSTRQSLGVTSASLDFLTKFKGLDQKAENEGMDLWLKCMGEMGDDAIEPALVEMAEYCVRDTEILEQYYLELRPWIATHPNVPLYDDKPESRCRVCGSNKLEWSGKHTTLINRYSAYICKNCGYRGYSRNTELTTAKKDSMNK